MDYNNRAILALCNYLSSDADDMSLMRVYVSLHVAIMFITFTLRKRKTFRGKKRKKKRKGLTNLGHQDFNIVAYHLGGSPSKSLLGSGIKELNDAGLIDDHTGIKQLIQQRKHCFLRNETIFKKNWCGLGFSYLTAIGTIISANR